MKPVQIQFTPDRNWLLPCLVTALACGAVLGDSAWRWRQDQLAMHALDVRLTAARKLADARAEQANVPDPYKAQKQALQRVLEADLSNAFAAVENMDEPKASLRSMEIDVSGNSVRLQYDFPAVTDAASVTFELNSGYDRGPWRLQGVGAVGASQAGTSAQTFQGSWSVALDKLQHVRAQVAVPVGKPKSVQ
jgi:hypothetical protein